MWKGFRGQKYVVTAMFITAFCHNLKMFQRFNSITYTHVSTFNLIETTVIIVNISYSTEWTISALLKFFQNFTYYVNKNNMHYTASVAK